MWSMLHVYGSAQTRVESVYPMGTLLRLHSLTHLPFSRYAPAPHWMHCSWKSANLHVVQPDVEQAQLLPVSRITNHLHSPFRGWHSPASASSNLSVKAPVTHLSSSLLQPHSGSRAHRAPHWMLSHGSRSTSSSSWLESAAARQSSPSAHLQIPHANGHCSSNVRVWRGVNLMVAAFNAQFDPAQLLQPCHSTSRKVLSSAAAHTPGSDVSGVHSRHDKGQCCRIWDIS